MDIEAENNVGEHERIYSEYLARLNYTDTHRFSLDLDSFRVHHSSTAQDIIKNPQRYYKLTKAFLEKLGQG